MKSSFFFLSLQPLSHTPLIPFSISSLQALPYIPLFALIQVHDQVQEWGFLQIDWAFKIICIPSGRPVTKYSFTI